MRTRGITKPRSTIIRSGRVSASATRRGTHIHVEDSANGKERKLRSALLPSTIRDAGDKGDSSDDGSTEHHEAKTLQSSARHHAQDYVNYPAAFTNMNLAGCIIIDFCDPVVRTRLATTTSTATTTTTTTSSAPTPSSSSTADASSSSSLAQSHLSSQNMAAVDTGSLIFPTSTSNTRKRTSSMRDAGMHVHGDSNLEKKRKQTKPKPSSSTSAGRKSSRSSSALAPPQQVNDIIDVATTVSPQEYVDAKAFGRPWKQQIQKCITRGGMLLSHRKYDSNKNKHKDKNQNSDTLSLASSSVSPITSETALRITSLDDDNTDGVVVTECKTQTSHPEVAVASWNGIYASLPVSRMLLSINSQHWRRCLNTSEFCNFVRRVTIDCYTPFDAYCWIYAYRFLYSGQLPRNASLETLARMFEIGIQLQSPLLISKCLRRLTSWICKLQLQLLPHQSAPHALRPAVETFKELLALYEQLGRLDVEQVQVQELTRHVMAALLTSVCFMPVTLWWKHVREWWPLLPIELVHIIMMTNPAQWPVAHIFQLYRIWWTTNCAMKDNDTDPVVFRGPWLCAPHTYMSLTDLMLSMEMLSIGDDEEDVPSSVECMMEMIMLPFCAQLKAPTSSSLVAANDDDKDRSKAHQSWVHWDSIVKISLQQWLISCVRVRCNTCLPSVEKTNARHALQREFDLRTEHCHVDRTCPWPIHVDFDSGRKNILLDAVSEWNQTRLSKSSVSKQPPSGVLEIARETDGAVSKTTNAANAPTVTTERHVDRKHQDSSADTSSCTKILAHIHDYRSWLSPSRGTIFVLSLDDDNEQETGVDLWDSAGFVWRVRATVMSASSSTSVRSLSASQREIVIECRVRLLIDESGVQKSIGLTADSVLFPGRLFCLAHVAPGFDLYRDVAINLADKDTVARFAVDTGCSCNTNMPSVNNRSCSIATSNASKPSSVESKRTSEEKSEQSGEPVVDSHSARRRAMFIRTGKALSGDFIHQFTCTPIVSLKDPANSHLPSPVPPNSVRGKLIVMCQWHEDTKQSVS